MERRSVLSVGSAFICTIAILILVNPMLLSAFVPLMQQMGEEAMADIQVKAINDAKADEGSATGYAFAGFFCGIFGWIFAKASNVSIPSERLVGKSEKYVQVYSAQYKGQIKKIRSRAACNGWAAGVAVGSIVNLVVLAGSH
jgi:hypothetical protein